MTQQDADDIVTLATVMVRQRFELHRVIGEINDLRFSDPTMEEVVAVRDQFHREKDFAGYTVDATNALLAKIK